MKVPQLARYNGVVEKAYDFVINNITEFPINLFDLIKKFGWKIITYEDLASKNKCSVKIVEECFGKDAYSIYDYKTNNYKIAYNNTISNKGRINFTLAHEIGHIILNHHKDFEGTDTLQNNLTKEEYKILENEANCFARNILAPAPLMKKLSLLEVLGKTSDIFGISFSATTTRLKFLNNDLYYLNESSIDYLKNTYKRFKGCTKCACNNLSIESQYCPCCGKKSLIIGDGFKMKIYKGINIKELGECPRCENGDIIAEDKFCKICGLQLINSCIVCGKTLDISARFCRNCGTKSPYFSAGLLSDWQSATDVETLPNINFNSQFETSSSDDLPF